MEEPTQQSKEKTEKPSTLQEPKKTRLDIKGGLISSGVSALWMLVLLIGGEILNLCDIGSGHNLRIIFVVLWAAMPFWFMWWRWRLRQRRHDKNSAPVDAG
jgi:Flp pilus assembly protein TadB